MTLDEIIIRLRPLLVEYCAQNAPTLYPVINHSWRPAFAVVSVSLYDKDDEGADSCAYINFWEGEHASAAKVLEALILDRHARAKERGERVAAEKAEADDRATTPGPEVPAVGYKPEIIFEEGEPE